MYWTLLLNFDDFGRCIDLRKLNDVEVRNKVLWSIWELHAKARGIGSKTTVRSFKVIFLFASFGFEDFFSISYP